MPVEFFVGINPEDRCDLEDFIYYLNSLSDPINHVAVINEFDEPDGYYMYTIHGSWAAYNKLKSCTYVKSIEHFEED
jgi:hypothetical protein